MNTKPINISKSDLYQTILELNIDEESISFPFSERVSRDNAWSLAFSRRCIVEYKRFVYLCAISDEPLTPSDQVDQVWHLHLAYTRSYWIDLCRDILKKDLHHGPTKGGRMESEKYQTQYQDTIDLYLQEFGEAPPQDIWPDLHNRFKNADQFVRINKSGYWLLQKPSRIVAPLVLAPLLLVACTSEEFESDFWFYAKVALGVYVVYKVLKWLVVLSGGKGGGSGCGTGCSGCGGCGD